MRLLDLLYKIDDTVTIWVTEDPSKYDGIYFGFVSDIKLRTAAGYDVINIYPEHYPAIHNFVGITIVVKKSD